MEMEASTFADSGCLLLAWSSREEAKGERETRDEALGGIDWRFVF